MSKPRKTKGPGRPPGAPDREYAAATIRTSACPKCGSTERTAYGQKTERVLNSKRHVWRRCRCQQCGQWRIDKEVLPLVLAKTD